MRLSKDALAVALGSLMVSGLGLLAADLPLHDLSEFGFANKAPLSPWPMLVVLAHFTDGAFVGTTDDWDHYMFDTGSPSNTLNGYFDEVSNGRFQFAQGGTILIQLPGNARHANLLASITDTNLTPVERGSLADGLYTSNIVYHAMLATDEFNFADYDDGDGTVHREELVIAVINNDGYAGGRGSGDVQPDPNGVTYNGKVSFQQNSFASGDFQVMCHEVGHTIEAEDLYGAWTSEERLHHGLSIMSAETHPCHFDAWHKLQFGWVDPRVYSLPDGGVDWLPAASSMDPMAPILLYDPARGPEEFFLLEYRTRTNASQIHHYDRHVHDDGLLIWHVYQGDRWPVQYGDLVYPDAEPGWRECVYCRNLIHEDFADRPCASPDSPNGEHKAFNAGSYKDDHRLVADDPAYGGQTGWRQCGKCGCLYYHPNVAESVCAADGGPHEIRAGSVDYQIRMDVPDMVGHTYWRRCRNCQLLFTQSQTGTYGLSDCPKPGSLLHDPSTNRYVLIPRWAHLTVMAEAPPDLLKGNNVLWKGGMTTPNLRWYDGTDTGVNIYIYPFAPGDDGITVDWATPSETWVDFAYSGIEEGTFTRPYDTFAEGVENVGRGGTLHVKTGQSGEAAWVDKRMKVRAYGGPVHIGR